MEKLTKQLCTTPSGPEIETTPTLVIYETGFGSVQQIAAAWFPQIALIYERITEFSPQIQRRIKEAYIFIKTLQALDVKSNSRYFICKDSKGDPLAIMELCTFIKSCEIELLCSAPNRAVKHGEKGGASALVHHAQKIAAHKEISHVTTLPIGTACSFYSKLGFTSGPGGWSIPSVLSPYTESHPAKRKTAGIPCFISMEELKEMRGNFIVNTLIEASKEADLSMQIIAIFNEDKEMISLAGVSLKDPETIKIIDRGNAPGHRDAAKTLEGFLKAYSRETKRTLIW